MSNKDEERFWKNVRLKRSIAPGMLTLCWQYGEGSRYGMTSVDGEEVYAHVNAWQLKGSPQPPPQGFALHHLCDNKRCVNTDHIVMATSSGHKRQLHSVKLKASFPCGCDFDEEHPQINEAGRRLCRKHRPIPASCNTREQKKYLAKVGKLANIYGDSALGRLGSFPKYTVKNWVNSHSPIATKYFAEIDELFNQWD